MMMFLGLGTVMYVDESECCKVCAWPFAELLYMYMYRWSEFEISAGFIESVE